MPINYRPRKSRNTPGQIVLQGMADLEPNKQSPPVHHELAEQKQLFFWLRRWEKKYPELEWVHSSLNGLPLTPKVMRDATESGMRSGIWDVLVPYRRKGHTSFYLEMKWDDNDLSPNQKRYLQHLRNEGFKTAKCYSAIAAARAILDYLDIVDEEIERELRINMKRSTRAEPIYCDDDCLLKPARNPRT